MAALAATIGCSGGDDAGGADGGADDDASAATEPAPTDPPYAVGRHDLVLVDPTRGTPAVPERELEAADSRTIEVIVTYPAAGDPGPEPPLPDGWDDAGFDDDERTATVDAAAIAGPLPLVVFAHGWNGQGSSFLALAERWSRAGYVVALPTFPRSRNGIGFSADFPEQPADLSFVVDELIAAEAPLAGLVDGERLVLGGHSLGSATVFRAAYNSCCVDPRIDATIAVSGGPQDIGEGGYDDQPETPMLLVHGVADPGVLVGVSDSMVAFVAGPVTYLRLDEADHVSMFVGVDGELFDEAVLAFLDAELRDDPAALDSLGDTVAASGRGELRSG